MFAKVWPVLTIVAHRHTEIEKPTGIGEIMQIWLNMLLISQSWEVLLVRNVRVENKRYFLQSFNRVNNF